MNTGRRVHERYERQLDVVVIHEGQRLECVTQNVSLGGMYLLTPAALPYGTKVQVEVFLPALREKVTIECTVRWSKPDGMGVQFGSLRAREVWALNQLFKDAPGPTSG